MHHDNVQEPLIFSADRAVVRESRRLNDLKLIIATLHCTSLRKSAKRRAQWEANNLTMQPQPLTYDNAYHSSLSFILRLKTYLRLKARGVLVLLKWADFIVGDLWANWQPKSDSQTETPGRIRVSGPALQRNRPAVGANGLRARNV